jgi:transcriptional regulator of acetoin/glycerol metabolism
MLQFSTKVAMSDGEHQRLPVWVGMTLEATEKVLIAATLGHLGWNIKQAAEMLGIDRSTLYGKIRRYQLGRRIAFGTGQDADKE